LLLKFVFLNQVVYPVLEWLLSRIDDLKKRAYLAKFLVKVEIPPEVVADPDLSDMYDQVTFIAM
jgi:intraflagellar transport protein 81